MSCEEGFLMNLPSEIIVDIFSRLPATSVINCKLVCKKSLNILSTPHFVKLHLSRSNPGLVVFQHESGGLVCRLLEIEDEFDHHHLYYNPIIKFELPAFPDIRGSGTVLVSSINGLVFFQHAYREWEALYVCNPTTREYVTLPIVKGFVEQRDIVAYGFGVSTISGQYKAVRICHDELWESDDVRAAYIGFKNSECSVYTLGTGLWRIIEGVPTAHDYVCQSFPVGLFFNGNLHWLLEDLVGSEYISCFDLEKESFHSLPPPYTVGRSKETTTCSLGVVEGCLCCLCCDTSVSDSHVDIWVMKEYGVKTSWTKQFVIGTIPDSVWWTFGTIYALKFFKDGEILFGKEDNYLFSYNNQSKTLQMVDTIHNDRIQSALHVSSFLSLKDFALEEVRRF